MDAYQPHCPTPVKIRYLNGKEAVEALAVIQRTQTVGEKGYHRPIRAYECVAGHWHLTSHQKREAGEHRPEDHVPVTALSPHDQRVRKALALLDMIEDAEAQGGKAELVLPGGVRRRLHAMM